MASINSITVSGRVGQRGQNSFGYSASGTARLSFSIAVSAFQKNADGTNGEKAIWIDCCIWGKRAESLNEMLIQGTNVGVTGKIDTNEWTDQQTGQKRTRHYIIASDVVYFARPQNQQPQQQQQPQKQQSQGFTPNPMYQQQTQNNAFNKGASFQEDTLDEVPF